MRERVEDLGRIAALMRAILDMPLFEERHYRKKDFLEHLEALTEDKREELLHDIPYQVDDVKDKLYEILEIAEGMDLLNQQESYEV